MPFKAPSWPETIFAGLSTLVIAGVPAGTAIAQPAASPAASTIDGPIDPVTAKWRRLPSGEEVAQVYPAKAMQMGVSGAAVIQCRVVPSGNLADCSIAAEKPANYGFGEAALALAPHFHLRSAAYGPNASIQIPIGFSIVP